MTDSQEQVRPCILIIDDDPDDRALVIRGLNRELDKPHIAEITSQGELDEALTSLNYDIVITDYEIRWTNGIEVVKQIKAHKPKCPVIMFTGTGTEEVAVEAMKAGLQDYLLKSPSQYERLAVVVRRVLDKQAQQMALEEAEKRYQSLFDSVPVGLYRLGVDGQLMAANKALVDMLGYPSQEALLQVSVTELFEDRQQMRESRARVNNENVITAYEQRIKKRDGSFIWVSLSGIAVRDKHGNPIYYEGSVEDISTRKSATAERDRQLLELGVLHAVASAANQATDEDGLIAEATHIMGKTLYSDNFGVVCLHPKTKRLQSHPSYHGLNDELNQDTLAIGEGIVGAVAADLTARNTTDVREDKDYISYDPETRSELCVPLLVGGELYGVINAESKQLNAFTEEDERLLSTFAGQLGIAINSLRLFEKTAEALAREQHVNEITRIISGPLDLQSILQSIGALTAGLVGADIAAIAIGDIAEKSLTDFYYHNLPEPLSDIPQPQGHGALWKAFLTGESLLLEDYSKLDLPVEEANRASLHATLAVPIPQGEVIIGSLALITTKASKRFTLRDLALIESVARQAGIVIQNANLYQELELSYLQTVSALANAIDVRDSYTQDHSQRLAIWAESTAEELECSQEECEAVRWGAMLHDIGKIGIPDEILNKPGPLTGVECDIVKKHPDMGAAIIEPISKLTHVAPLIRAHQERFDGTGYPQGLEGETIPIGARIIAVVDAYIAITDDRVYRAARSHEEAVEELTRNAGSQFDPEVVNAFLKVIARERQSKREKTPTGDLRLTR
ncbi:MAG: GAF domain-containing protein [Chloroflexi bacterium]|nr:GAF domain-containing protein [Chloroflexota bacterium]